MTAGVNRLLKIGLSDFIGMNNLSWTSAEGKNTLSFPTMRDRKIKKPGESFHPPGYDTFNMKKLLTLLKVQ